jgi:hypothetical protein
MGVTLFESVWTTEGCDGPPSAMYQFNKTEAFGTVSYPNETLPSQLFYSTKWFSYFSGGWEKHTATWLHHSNLTHGNTSARSSAIEQ